MADSAEMGLLMMLFESWRSTLDGRARCQREGITDGEVDVLLHLHDDLLDPVDLLPDADEVIRLERESREPNGGWLDPQGGELDTRWTTVMS